MKTDKNFVLGVLTGAVTVLALVIAWLSYKEQVYDNRLDELLGVIALDAEKRAEYVRNKGLMNND